MITDRIEKQIFLKASRSRVWRALTDAKEFGSWFGMRLEGPFAPGATMRGVIVPTTADAEVAKLQKSFEDLSVELVVAQIEPERFFSFRWHPFAIDRKADYSKEPMTLITFSLEEKDRGVLLTVTETGFDQLPLARRAAALKSNEEGWALQMQLIEKHLAHAA